MTSHHGLDRAAITAPARTTIPVPTLGIPIGLDAVTALASRGSHGAA